MTDDASVEMGTTIGADGEAVQFPRYRESLAEAKPFLMPGFQEDEVIEILPSEKANKKIRFDEQILIQEIENRFAYSFPEDDDDDSYEIEIVEDDGDADFYLEIVDGEVFYVFETEDDISEDESEESDDMEDSETETDQDAGPRQPLQLPIATMSAPLLDDDDDSNGVEPSSGASRNSAPSPQMDFHASMSSIMSENEDMLVLDEEFYSEDDQKDAAEQRPSSPPSVQAVPATPTSPDNAEDQLSSSAVVSSEEEPSTPPRQPKGAVALVDHFPEPVSPIAKNLAPASPGTGIKTPVKSILKACPESPKKPPTPKKKKKKGDKKKEKTFTKTYVRPEEFDGEHRVYTWEKPDCKF